MMFGLRTITKLVRTGVLIYLLTVGVVGIHAYWLARFAPMPAPAPWAIVLGGALNEDATVPGSPTGYRVERGIALVKSGHATGLVMTGGSKGPPPKPGTDMYTMARRALGPDPAIAWEIRSLSTAQNALYSADRVDGLRDAPVILVSDGYHLARAWVTFRWAGYRNVSLVAASAFGSGPPGDKAYYLFREGAAWWFNIARLTGWSLARAFGLVSDEDDWLIAHQSDQSTKTT